MREEKEEGRRRKEKERLEEEEEERKRARKFMEGSVEEEGEEEVEEEEHQGQTEEEIGDISYRPHIRTRPTHVNLKLPVKQFREEASNIANNRKLSDSGQSDILSAMVLHGGGDLKDFPCSRSTMRK